MNKKNVTNPARYWIGIGMGSLEVLVLIGFALSLISWAWLTKEILLILLVSSAILIYNGIAGLLVWSGSRKD